MAGQMTERLSASIDRHFNWGTFTPSFALPDPKRKDTKMPPWKSTIKAARELPETLKQANSMAIISLFVAIIALVVSVFTAVTNHGS